MANVRFTREILLIALAVASVHLGSVHDAYGKPGDADEDGYSDAVELSLGSDPFDAASTPADFDRDHIPDALDADDDNDGVADTRDAFPFNPLEYADTDGDGIGNNADNDDDNDCYADEIERDLGANPMNPRSIPDDFDSDCSPDAIDNDDDGDGVIDVLDRFPLDPAEYADGDSDGVGDMGDLDDDNDGVADTVDAFPFDPTEQTDIDGDGTGDHRDLDDDNDGVEDIKDLFPADPTEWSDLDGDGIGDNKDPDSAFDGFEGDDLNGWEVLISGGGSVTVVKEALHSQEYGCNGEGPVVLTKRLPHHADFLVVDMWFLLIRGDSPRVNFLGTGGQAISSVDLPLGDRMGRWGRVRLVREATSGQTVVYKDGEKIARVVDEGARMLIAGYSITIAYGSAAYIDDVSHSFSADLDGDGIPNEEDTDDDDDGVADAEDIFPLDVTECKDTDGDGKGNNADDDDDNDGLPDWYDAFPDDAAEWADTDADGLGDNADEDDDADGTSDVQDDFPRWSAESVDSDGDGVGNGTDPDNDNDGLSDEEEIAAGADVFDTDSDDDGVADGDEPRPTEDTDGDGLPNVLDPDSDNDGIMDGTEMGVTEEKILLRAASFKGISGSQRGSPSLVFDRDPTTTTDPLNADTDGGGLSDGVEDANHNGFRDIGEFDPTNAVDDTLPQFFTGNRGGCGLAPVGNAMCAEHALIIILAFLIPLLIWVISAAFFKGR